LSIGKRFTSSGMTGLHRHLVSATDHSERAAGLPSPVSRIGRVLPLAKVGGVA
jgi:hypothetical protein